MKKERKAFMLGSVLVILSLTFTSFMPARAATAPEPFKLTILSCAPGLSCNVFSIALAEIINKNSTWLKATSVVPAGDVTKLLAQMPPAERAHYIGNLADQYWYDARRHLRRYADMPNVDFTQMRYIVFQAVIGQGLWTTNPKLKTIEDLKGKKIGLDPLPKSAMNASFDWILARHGVTPKNSRIEYLQFDSIGNALKDGLLDAGRFGSFMVDYPGKHEPTVYSSELMQQTDVYPISIPKETIRALKKETGIPFEPMTLKPGIMGKNHTEPCVVSSKYQGWGGFLEVPDHVVSEILRCMYKDYAIFKRYLPSGAIIRPENFGMLAKVENDYHPASVKFFKEHNIKIGSFEE